MATRSTIAVLHTDGTVSSSYCHWDGYLTHHGRILVQHYNTLELAEELISHGSMSSLAESITPAGAHTFDDPEKGCTVYYGRDRGETDTAPILFDDLTHYYQDNDNEEYDYLFIGNTWMYSTDGAWREVAGALLDEDADD